MRDRYRTLLIGRSFVARVRRKTKPVGSTGSFVGVLTVLVTALHLVGPATVVQASTTIPVTTNSDTVADDGECSLREAIAAANTDTPSGSSPGECPAGSGSDTIKVPAFTIELGSTLVISSPVDLVGSGLGTVVDGNGQGRVFLVRAGEVTLQALTITGGSGGVSVEAGSTLEISDALITKNSMQTGGGGGLVVFPTAVVTVRRTTIEANRAAQAGGIHNGGTLFVHESLIGGVPPTSDLLDPGTGNISTRVGGIANTGVLFLHNTTVSGNGPVRDTSATTGGIHNSGIAFLNNVTITLNRGVGVGGPNRAGGLASGPGATTQVNNSILANNSIIGGGADDCLGPLAPDSVYNLIEDIIGCTLPPNPATFILNKPAELGELADNGGPTFTHHPEPGSPVIDKGFPGPPGGPAPESCEPIDQRLLPRLLICDMGAVEVQVPVPTVLVVNTTVDEVDALPGDGICATVSGTCSLRAAVQEANRLPGSQTITVPAGTYDLSIPTGDEGFGDPAAAAGGDLDLLDDVVVAGAGRARVIIDGNDLSRIFDVHPGVRAGIREVTIRDGTDSGGGGVRVTTGSLTLRNAIVEDNESTFKGGGIEVGGLDSVLVVRSSIVRNNRAPGFGGDGGGIDATGEITIERSQITDNVATGSGGGLHAFGLVTVLRSTVSGNVASGGVFAIGGGINAVGLTLVESTVSGNTADDHGGGVFAGGESSIVNSTISGNTAGTNGGGVSTSGSLSLLHVTVAANTATGGGNGLLRFGGFSELSLQNTILANPSGTECAGLPPTSGGNNIASDASCGLTAGGDKQNTDARIGPLSNNGGPTLTHLPELTSPAINAAATASLPNDQRGFPRPLGPAPDIGSVERI